MNEIPETIPCVSASLGSRDGLRDVTNMSRPVSTPGRDRGREKILGSGRVNRVTDAAVTHGSYAHPEVGRLEKMFE
jgi:hypothetical protein